MPSIIDTPRISSMGEIFGLDDRQYRVPPYQRDYEWGEDQIDDFVEDLFRINHDEDEHFLGTIVISDNAPGPLHKGPDSIKYIIDGQQRLITYLLMIAVIRHNFFDIGNIDRDGLTNAVLLGRLLFNGDYEHEHTHRPKIHANRINQVILSSIFSGKTEKRKDVQEAFERLDEMQQARSTKIYKAYKRLSGLVSWHICEKLGIAKEDTSPEDAVVISPESFNKEQILKALSILKQLIVRMKRQVKVVEINIPSWKDAFIAFEGLNNRGLELSEKDLIKNLILSKTPEKESSGNIFFELEEKWAEIESRIAESKFANFLRHYLLLHLKEVPLKKVVRILSDFFEKSGSKHMIEEIEKASVAYEKITKPSREANLKVRLRLQKLGTLGAFRSFPIPLALKLKNISSADEEKVLRAVEILYFRRSAIMQKDNKTIESEFREIAAIIYSGGKESIKKALEKINKITPIDSEFIPAFKAKRDMKPNVAKYTLSQIEIFLRSRHQMPFKYEESSVEHIMPKNTAQWKLTHTEKENFSMLLNRIGNLTLLSVPGNSSSSNRPFKDKIKLYKKDGLRINDYVLTCPNWGQQQIEERQEKLSLIASKVWPK